MTRLAKGFLAAGLSPGDRVGIWSPNNTQWVLTQFATARAGLILVNLNPAYRRVELEFALRRVGCRMLILAPSFKSSDYVAIVRGMLPASAFQGRGQVRADPFPALEWVAQLGPQAASGFMAFDELCAANTESAADSRLGTPAPTGTRGRSQNR